MLAVWQGATVAVAWRRENIARADRNWSRVRRGDLCCNSSLNHDAIKLSAVTLIALYIHVLIRQHDVMFLATCPGHLRA